MTIEIVLNAEAMIALITFAGAYAASKMFKYMPK